MKQLQLVAKTGIQVRYSGLKSVIITTQLGYIDPLRQVLFRNICTIEGYCTCFSIHNDNIIAPITRRMILSIHKDVSNTTCTLSLSWVIATFASNVDRRYSCRTHENDKNNLFNEFPKYRQLCKFLANEIIFAILPVNLISGGASPYQSNRERYSRSTRFKLTEMCLVRLQLHVLLQKTRASVLCRRIQNIRFFFSQGVDRNLRRKDIVNSLRRNFT